MTLSAPAPSTLALAAEIAEIKRRLSSRNSSQLAYSSIEDGSIKEYNRDGLEVARYGRQHDGTHMAAPLVGPQPPVPTSPILEPAPGAIIARSSGTFVDDALVPMDYSRLEVYASTDATMRDTSPYDPASLRATIETPRGGEVALVLPQQPYYVWFVARSLTGRASEPSAAAVETPAAVGAGGSSTTFSIDAPGTSPGQAGDEWRQVNLSNEIIGQWRHDGTDWVAVKVSGSALAATAIDGKTITGAFVRTAASGARWELSGDGVGVAAKQWLRAYSGMPDETGPGGIESSVFAADAAGNGTRGALNLFAPKRSGASVPASLLLDSGGFTLVGDSTAGSWSASAIHGDATDISFMAANDVANGVGGGITLGVNSDWADATGGDSNLLMGTGHGYGTQGDGWIQMFVDNPGGSSSAAAYLDVDNIELSQSTANSDAVLDFGIDYSTSNATGAARRRNLIPYADLSTLSAGWTAVGTGTTRDLFSDNGSSVLRVVLGTAANCGVKHKVAVTAGAKYAFPLYWKATSTLELRARWLNSSNAVISTSGLKTLTGTGGQYVGASAEVVAPTGATSVEFEVARPGTGATGDTIYIKTPGVIDVPAGTTYNSPGYFYFNGSSSTDSYRKTTTTQAYRLEYRTDAAGVTTEYKVTLDVETPRLKAALNDWAKGKSGSLTVSGDGAVRLEGDASAYVGGGASYLNLLPTSANVVGGANIYLHANYSSGLGSNYLHGQYAFFMPGPNASKASTVGLVVGSNAAGYTGEPSIRLRRRFADDTDYSEVYHSLQSGNAPVYAMSLRAGSGEVNSFVLRNDGRATVNGKNIPIYATGSANVPLVAAGGSSGVINVNFPTGRFTAVPRVTCNPGSSRLNASIGTVTTTGFTFVCDNWSPAGASATTLQWIAVQE